jgi:hypothetical protein
MIVFQFVLKPRRQGVTEKHRDAFVNLCVFVSQPAMTMEGWFKLNGDSLFFLHAQKINQNRDLFFIRCINSLLWTLKTLFNQTL